VQQRQRLFAARVKNCRSHLAIRRRHLCRTHDASDPRGRELSRSVRLRFSPSLGERATDGW
jgi:hypothetical protein